ncbi:MAG: PASTA domain-containing protein [Candidatus Cryptobacteroides sp.]
MEKNNKDKKIKKEGRWSGGRWILYNLLGALAVVTVLIAAAVVLLNVFTKHNKELVVPDFSNLTLNEARSLAAASDMRVEVTDSVFVKRMRKGTVYRQNPAAGDMVKSGRRISLTINAVNAKKVTMPNLIGYSMRQAKAELLSRGLVLGNLIYEPDIATNNVLRQYMDGSEIEPGVQIESESVIDIVVGLNGNDCVTYVPDLLGIRHLGAVDAVHDNSLNVGRLRFDNTVKDYEDSLNAVVYRQEPDISPDPVPMGSEIVLYLTTNTSKVPVRIVEEEIEQ